jgi:hypothetical protein
VQRRGAGVDCNTGALEVEVAGELLLEGRHLVALGEHSRPQHPGHGSDLSVADDGSGHRHDVSHLLSCSVPTGCSTSAPPTSR